MITILILNDDGEWVPFGTAASPSVIEKYLDLVRRLHPNKQVKVEKA